MIVVLADDLSGAAELAGLAHRHGLAAELQTDFQPATGPEVLCLDTDSRLLPAEQAAARVAALARTVAATGPDWMFLKCDSVLRGPVLATARAAAAATGKTRIFLAPANPSRGRVIRDGQYFVGPQPLHETAFARDPHHPRFSSRVADLLGGDLTGVTVAEAAELADLVRHARSLDASALPVGAADFFAALLTVRAPRSPRPAAAIGRARKTLLVCGSAAAWPQRRTEAPGSPAFSQPHDPDAIARSLTTDGRALIGIGQETAGAPEFLLAKLAETVTAILPRIQPDRLLLEGGATAATVVRSLGWTRLLVTGAEEDVAALQPGTPGAPVVHIKPGSYPWPRALWPDGR